jgi:hypothetical protein
MSQISAKPTPLLVWILMLFGFFFVFLFGSLQGNLTISNLAKVIVRAAASLGPTVVIAFGCGIAIFILRIYWAIRAKMQYPVSPRLALLQLADLPAEIAPKIANAASALSPLGFRLIGCVKDIASSGSTFYQGIFQNPRSGTIARCALDVQNDRKDYLLAFHTRFSDGTDCATVHMSPAYLVRSVQARPKGRSTLAFFDIEDPVRLARLHAAAVEKHHSGPLDTGTLEPVTFQAETIEREMAIQIEAGYLRKEGDECRPTRVGAMKVALKLVWPAFAIRIRSARRRAKRFLEETNL